MPASVDILCPLNGDYTLTATGDLALVQDAFRSPAATQQRIVRILMTSPILFDDGRNPIGRPDDLCNPTFGAGLPAIIGKGEDAALEAAISSRISAALALDPDIATSPPPTVSVSDDGTGDGALYVSVTCYTVAGQKVTTPSVALRGS